MRGYRQAVTEIKDAKTREHSALFFVKLSFLPDLGDIPPPVPLDN